MLAIQLPKPKKDDVEVKPGVPPLSAYAPPPSPVGVPEWNAAQEEKKVAAIRAHRATINGEECQIVRGDLHSHTELSWDVGSSRRHVGSY